MTSRRTTRPAPGIDWERVRRAVPKVTCCAPHCSIAVLAGYQACSPHWNAVPRAYRDLLVPAFRQRESDPQTYAAAVTEARRLIAHYATVAVFWPGEDPTSSKHSRIVRAS